MNNSKNAIEAFKKEEKRNYKIRCILAPILVIIFAYYKCVTGVDHPVPFAIILLVMFAICIWLPFNTKPPMIKYYDQLLKTIDTLEALDGTIEYQEPVIGNGRFECGIFHKYLYKDMYKYFYMNNLLRKNHIDPISFDQLIIYLDNFKKNHELVNQKYVKEFSIRNYVLDDLFYKSLCSFEIEYLAYCDNKNNKIDYRDLLADTFKELEMEIDNIFRTAMVGKSDFNM